MTGKQATEMEFVVNIDAAAAYRDSDLGAFLDGYADGMKHVFHIERGVGDDAYFAGYRKAVADERKMQELGWPTQTEVERDEVWQQRLGWQI